jgi:hypothetical protein
MVQCGCQRQVEVLGADVVDDDVFKLTQNRKQYLDQLIDKVFESWRYFAFFQA